MIGIALLTVFMILFTVVGFLVVMALYGVGAAMLFYMLCMVLIVVLIFMGRSRFKKKMRQYEKVSLGMSEAEMLEIMGKKYNKSLLKNNRTKYEWRYSNGMSSSYKGTRFYSGVSKVDIYLKDGIVEEVRPFNC